MISIIVTAKPLYLFLIRNRFSTALYNANTLNHLLLPRLNFDLPCNSFTDHEVRNLSCASLDLSLISHGHIDVPIYPLDNDHFSYVLTIFYETTSKVLLFLSH